MGFRPMNVDLQTFKNAFALTDSGGFKHSVDRTKGEFYIKGGKLCSANIHGGKGTVGSAATNRALRQALLDAFRSAGASDRFMTKAEAMLGGDNAEKTLLRKDVKRLLGQYDTSQKDDAVEMSDVNPDDRQSEPLSLEHFRALAKGSGVVGSNRRLRLSLFEAIWEAKDPKSSHGELSDVRRKLLNHLVSSLIDEKNLDKPITSEEIGRTLKALDDGLGFVPPKPLESRDFHVTKLTGKKANLVKPQAKAAQPAMVNRYATSKLNGLAGNYVGRILNNASDGNCLFYSVADATKGLPQAEKNNRTAADEMRAQLSKHVNALLRHAPGQGKGLRYDKDGMLLIPHAKGDLPVDHDSMNATLTNPTFAQHRNGRAQIPIEQVAFLADMIKRPIALLLDIAGSKGPEMICFNRNLQTGEKLTGEPLAIYFSGTAGSVNNQNGRSSEGSGHYQAITLNNAGEEWLERLVGIGG